MLSWSKISAARASAAPGPARCREIYQRYAAVLYRQALLNSDDTARPRPAVGDALVNERALAVMTGSIRGAQPPGTPEHRREHAGVMGTRRVRVRFRRPLRQPVYAGGAARWAFHAAIQRLGAGTAADVNASGFGVCRDFAHLAISFCRALNIPARPRIAG